MKGGSGMGNVTGGGDSESDESCDACTCKAPVR